MRNGARLIKRDVDRRQRLVDRPRDAVVDHASPPFLGAAIMQTEYCCAPETLSRRERSPIRTTGGLQVRPATCVGVCHHAPCCELALLDPQLSDACARVWPVGCIAGCTHATRHSAVVACRWPRACSRKCLNRSKRTFDCSTAMIRYDNSLQTAVDGKCAHLKALKLRRGIELPTPIAHNVFRLPKVRRLARGLRRKTQLRFEL